MTNTPLGFPYPALSSAPNVPADIQALATALDTYLGGASGWVACPATSGYTSQLSAWIFGPLTILSGSVTKNTGSFSGTVQVASLPSSAYAPLTLERRNLYGLVSGSTSEQCELEIAASATAITATYLGTGSFSTLYFGGVVYAHV